MSRRQPDGNKDSPMTHRRMVVVAAKFRTGTDNEQWAMGPSMGPGMTGEVAFTKD